MKKIPTLFARDIKTRKVIDKVTPGCEWVLRGEGIATRKIDGTCCFFHHAQLYKRRIVLPGKSPPEFFELVDSDPVTGKSFGWVPVDIGPEDKWHREAWERQYKSLVGGKTYELVGPKVQGNPEQSAVHVLVEHGALKMEVEPSFEKLREFLAGFDGEGIVWYHRDDSNKRAKLKRRDF